MLAASVACRGASSAHTRHGVQPACIRACKALRCAVPRMASALGAARTTRYLSMQGRELMSGQVPYSFTASGPHCKKGPPAV